MKESGEKVFRSVNPPVKHSPRTGPLLDQQ